MAKYSLEFKLKVVHHYLTEQIGWRRMSKHFGVGQSDIRKWVAHHQKYGEAGLTNNNTRKKYSGELKLQIISSVLEQGLSLREVALKYDIKSHSLIIQWLKLKLKGLSPVQYRTQSQLT